MDTLASLKQALHQMIDAEETDARLTEIYHLLQQPKAVRQATPFECEQIDKGRADVAAGRVTPLEEYLARSEQKMKERIARFNAR